MISQRLFVLIYRHFVLGVHDKEDEIRKLITQKNEAMIKRYVYTQSKTAATEEEREKARQEYLDMVGVTQDFRY